MAPLVSCAVVIPVHNGGDLLAGLVRALEPQCRSGVEIVISDDGSTDGAAQQVAEMSWQCELTVVRSATATGAGAARNRGVATTDAEILVFVDADDVVMEGFLDAIVEPIRRGRADLVGAARDFDSLNGGLALSAAALRGSASSPQPLETGDPRVVSGGSGMAVLRERFDAIGGFDERLRRRQDQDFWLRAQSAGCRAEFAPHAVVAVRRRASEGDQLVQAREGGKWSQLFYELHPELVRSHREWVHRSSLPWIVLRLPYVLSASRRMVLLGGIARWRGRREGKAMTRGMRRSGELGPWPAQEPEGESVSGPPTEPRTAPGSTRPR